MNNYDHLMDIARQRMGEFQNEARQAQLAKEAQQFDEDAEQYSFQTKLVQKEILQSVKLGEMSIEEGIMRLGQLA